MFLYFLSMESAFTEWKIVPEVIDTLPAAVAEVVWPNGVKADMGKMLTPTQVWEQCFTSMSTSFCDKYMI